MSVTERTARRNVGRQSPVALTAKATLVDQLARRVYCRLAPSSVHGVGVVAIRDIPVGAQPFQSPFRRPYPIVALGRDDVERLHPAVQRLVHDFFLPERDGEQFAAIDPNVVDMSFYLNCPSDPRDANVYTVKCADGCGYDDIVTSRVIRAGEELLLDYRLALQCLN